jgi:hypothetical protein
MARKPKTSKSNNIPFIAEILKNVLGTQGAPLTPPGGLPVYDREVLKKLEGLDIKEMSNRDALKGASKDLLDKLGNWWKTGGEVEAKEPEKESKIKADTEKAKINKVAENKNMKDQLLASVKSQNILEGILSEITLLRRITEGSLKFEKGAKGSKYRDLSTGRYVKPSKSSIASKPAEKLQPSATVATPANSKPTVTTTTTTTVTEPITASVAEEKGIMGGLPDISISAGSKLPTTAPVPAAGGFMAGAARFMGGAGGLITAGVAGALGGGLHYYEKYNQASNEKQAEVMAATDQLKAGEISKQEFNQKVAEADKKSTITLGEGVGGGVGRFGGAIAGAKLGASFGTFFGPAGTVVGGLAGGALGYMAGGSIGEAAGNIGGRIANLFGGDSNKEVNNIQPANKTSAGNFTVQDNGITTSGEYRDGKYYINSKEVTEKEYQTVREQLGLGKIQEKLSNAKLVGSDNGAMNLNPAYTSRSGDLISAYSVANRDMASEGTAGTTIINNNSTTGSGPQTPSLIPLKPQIRPEDSTLTRYIDRVAFY